MSIAAWSLLLALLVARAVAQGPPESPKYLVGRGGPAFATAPGGYVPATLQDIQSKDFRDAYNPFGLQAANGGMSPYPYCAMLAVNEGLLAFGPTSNTTVVAPYDDSGAMQKGGSLSSPVWFGSAFNASYIGPITAAFQQGLYAVPSASSGGYCSSLAFWVIYRRAVFDFGRTGSSYPSQPSPDSTAVLASLEDLRSPDFVYGYNANGVAGLTYGSGAAGGCCAVRVQEGFLRFADSYIVPHFATSEGTDACDGTGFASFSGNQRFATRWGADSGYFLDRLNATTLMHLNVTRDAPSACSGQPPNSFAVLKSSEGVPSGGFGDCWEIEMRGGYYSPSSGSCLADKWRYVIRNNTVVNVTLDDFDDCGGTITAGGFSISTFNEQYASVSVESMTRCECTVMNALIPLVRPNEMPTLCHQEISPVAWCQLLVQVDKNYNCPTPAPGH